MAEQTTDTATPAAPVATPAPEGLAARLGDEVVEMYHEVKDAIFGTPTAPDGTLTVDFGNGDAIRGCHVLNSIPGTAPSFADGQQVQVIVPTANGTAVISVDGRFVRL